MADYYTQFSAHIAGITEEERSWLKEYLRPPSDEELSNPRLMEKWHEERNCPYNHLDNDPEFWPHFDWILDGPISWLIYSEDHGLVDAVEVVVQEFLKRFRPTEHFSMEWAATCSRPRPDGFGGGAIFVTAEDSKWINTCDWVAEQEDEANRA